MNGGARVTGCPDKKVADASWMRRQRCKGQEAPYAAVLVSRGADTVFLRWVPQGVQRAWRNALCLLAVNTARAV